MIFLTILKKICLGLFLGWLMELFYIIFVGFLSLAIKDNDFIRELSGSLKMFEFYLVPLVQCKTSAAFVRYIEAKDS